MTRLKLRALIRLYCDAVQAGAMFTILNPRPHVREILAIVGIDRLLMAANAENAVGTAMGMGAVGSITFLEPAQGWLGSNRG